ncbi:MAG: DoxX family protein [Planctomycetes bacterium]|nr:DoxX family protein [Planctomycetota bacterium]
MSQICRGPLSLAGRVLLCTIFFVSAAGNKVPNFNKVADIMEKQGVPVPKLLLMGAIVFLLVGSLSVIVGYQARFGAVLLAVFLVLATYYFHNFWALEGDARQEQTIQFMKNLSMFGAVLFLIANGPGAWSVDACLAKKTPAG